MFNVDECVLLCALITGLLHGYFETDNVICRELMYEIFIRDSGMNELSNALLGHILYYHLNHTTGNQPCG
jgi:hypothetical protein